MINAIDHHHVTRSDTRQTTHAAADAPQISAELKAQLEKTQARVEQFGSHARAFGQAMAQQRQAEPRLQPQFQASHQMAAAHAAQLGLEHPVGVNGFTYTEVSAHPEVMEERKKQQQREMQTVRDLHSAIDRSDRAYAALLRSFVLLPEGSDEVTTGVEGEAPINPHDKDASGLIWDSYGDFHDMVGALIEALQQNWMSKYQEAMKKFLEFYDEFDELLDTLRPHHINDKGDVEINFKLFHEKAKELFDKYGVNSGALASFTSEAAANEFKKSLGLPGLVVETVNGVSYVRMDMSAIKELQERYATYEKVHFDAAEYAAFVNFKDGKVEQIKHVSKVLTEKLSEMTQKFDSIVKTLSGTIDKMTEVLRAFINGFS